MGTENCNSQALQSKFLVLLQKDGIGKLYGKKAVNLYFLLNFTFY